MLWYNQSTSFEIAHKWMPQNIFDDKSTMAQVMAWAISQETITWSNGDPDLYGTT